MDIAAMSIGLSQVKVTQQAGLAVMKMAMESAKMQAGMVSELAEVSAKAMEQAIQPHLGQSVDIRI